MDGVLFPLACRGNSTGLESPPVLPLLFRKLSYQIHSFLEFLIFEEYTRFRGPRFDK